MKPKLYLAGPLFSIAERAFNVTLAQSLSLAFDVFLPQRDGHLFTELSAKVNSVSLAQRSIFLQDLDAIRRSEILLIILDGRTVDEGASFELGFAYALGKTCYGLQTDPRKLLPIGNNPMIEGSLQRVFISIDELTKWVSEQISMRTFS